MARSEGWDQEAWRDEETCRTVTVVFLVWRDKCCVSVEGLQPRKDPAFAVFKGESFRETL